MAKVTAADHQSGGTRVFNGPVEVGLRTLVLLVEASPLLVDLQRLVSLDYLLIHSGDVSGGPPSLHPPSPLRAGEVAVRRGLIEDGLHLYRAHGLIKQVHSDHGFAYVAVESGGAFLDAFTSSYVAHLRDRAAWIFERVGRLDANELQQVLDQSLGRWRTEFSVLSGEWAEE